VRGIVRYEGALLPTARRSGRSRRPRT
jgi:hypothetical protein